MDYKDILYRALKTFVQTFVAVLLVPNQPLSKQTLVAAVAAGISAVWNGVRQATTPSTL